MAEVMEVPVPDIGDFEDVPVIEVLVAVGDEVAAEQPLVTLESDKASMDVPAPAAGVVKELKVEVGSKVSEGATLLLLETGDEHQGTATSVSPEGTAQAQRPDEEAAIAAEAGDSAAGDAEAAPAEDVSEGPPAVEDAVKADAVYASPSVRRLARARGVDLRQVEGTGRKGRITKEDVERAAAGGGDENEVTVPSFSGDEGLGLAPWPKVDFAKFGEVERVPLSRIKRISGPNLARNWVRIPHVTHHDEADITELEAFRKQLNAEQDVKVTMVALLVKAVVASLKAFPEVNAALDGEELVLRKYYNIGFAADTPQGLVVPVIKGADAKGLLEVAEELRALSGKARDGKLMPGDMAGSTFTISSLGGIGGTGFTPIVNAPEVAILGVTRSAMKPVWDGTQFVPRLVVPLSLSYDHRVVDGALAARFVAHLVGVLEDLRRVLL
jgi:pyruvate dehydrogenase E2 component (dihydrolipoamide acetyltransferase)